MPYSQPPPGTTASRRSWGFAWLALCLALAVHVADEALTDFLALWNPLVESLRARLGWVPLPTFRFETWLGGLIAAVLVLLGLSPFAFRGAPWMRPVAYLFAAIMLANGAGHLAASVYLGRPAPGVWSAPLLLLAGGWLLGETRRLERSS